MNHEIHLGARARTIQPLRPSGRIELDGEAFAARSQGQWIDAQMDVVVVGTSCGNVIVRPPTEDDTVEQILGNAVAIDEECQDTPLHAPPAYVETLNSVAWGAIIGCIVIPIAWMVGTPLNATAILTPFAAAFAGFIFHSFVGQAIMSVAPREDHRRRAYVVAGMVVCGAVAGGVAGVTAGFAFLGLGLGIVVGAMLGGLASWTIMLILMVL